MLLLSLIACQPEPEEQPADAGCEEASGNICVYAGTGQAGIQLDEEHDRLESWLYFPMDAEVREGKPPVIVDWNNNVVRYVTEDDTIAMAVGTGYAGDGPGNMADYTEAGADGVMTALNHPTDATYMPSGELLISVWHNYKLRTWNPDTGIVHVIAGSEIGFQGDGGPAIDAYFSMPHSSAVTADGTIYVVDMRNERVRKIDTEGIITTVGGDGTQGYGGDDGPVEDAVFAFPLGTNPSPGGSVAVDDGHLYIADSLNNRIRVLDFATGMISTLVGTGTAGYSGDGGQAVDAELYYPVDLEVADGTLYIADTYNNAIRTVDLDSGIIETFAGTGEAGWSGDGGPAVDAQLDNPFGIGVHEDGRVFIADTYNHVIRVVYP